MAIVDDDFARLERIIWPSKAIETPEQRMRRRSPYEVRCPKCGASALAPCRFPSGKPILPHHARLKVITKEGEKVIMHDRRMYWIQMLILSGQLEIGLYIKRFFDPSLSDRDDVLDVTTALNILIQMGINRYHSSSQ